MNVWVQVAILIYFFLISIVVVISTGYTITLYYKVSEISSNGSTGRRPPVPTEINNVDTTENNTSQTFYYVLLGVIVLFILIGIVILIFIIAFNTQKKSVSQKIVVPQQIVPKYIASPQLLPLPAVVNGSGNMSPPIPINKPPLLPYVANTRLYH